MLPSLLARRPAASRHLLGLRGIADDHLLVADATPVAVLAVAAPTLALRGPDEADRTIEALRLALASLAFPFQVVVVLGPLDVEAAVAAHACATAAEPDAARRRLAVDHRAFLRALAHDHQLLERRAYLAVAAAGEPGPAAAPRGLAHHISRTPSAPRPMPAEALRELTARCAEIDRRLRPCQVAVRRLAGTELAGLLYRLVQPGLAHRQPLPGDLTHLAAGPVGRAGDRPTTGGAATGPVMARAHRLADHLAPGAVEERPDWLRVDERYAATLAVVGYRREVGADWLAPLWRCGLPLRVALHLDPLDARAALTRLARRKTRLEAAAALDERQGRTHTAAAAVALEDVLALEDTVERGVERLLTLGLYLTVEADAPARLVEAVRQLESVLGGLGLRSVRLTFDQPAGYRATLPLGRDEPRRSHAMTAAAVAAAFPVAGGADAGAGVVLGVDLHGGGLVELPLTGGPNRNLIALGPSGGGKSYAVKAALLQALILGTSVWVVDHEGEYAGLVDAAGGVTVRLAPGTGGAGLNPLAPAPAAPPADEDPGPDPLAERAATVVALLGVLLGAGHSLTAREAASVDRAVHAAYTAAGVTADPATWGQPPTLADLHDHLASGDDLARDLALRLARYTGGAAGLGGVGVAPLPAARLVRWDVRDLPAELTAAALLLLADAVWGEARRRPVDRLLVIDEAWQLIAHPAGGRFLSDLARRARKHALGLWVVSQDVRDLLEDPHGRAIAANAATALLLPQNERTIEPVVAAFGLGAGERALLLGARTGEALLTAGRERRAVRILVAPELDALLTTDPAALARRVAARQALWAGAGRR